MKTEDSNEKAETKEANGSKTTARKATRLMNGNKKNE